MKTFLKQSTEARRELILTAHPIKTLLILSLPSLLMNTVQAMMPFTDGLFINNLTNYAVTGAVTFSQPIISMVLGLSQGLSVAAMAIIGHARHHQRTAAPDHQRGSFTELTERYRTLCPSVHRVVQYCTAVQLFRVRIQRYQEREWKT